MAVHDQKLLASGRGQRRIGQLLVSLDLGATKIACMIARVTPPSEGGFDLIGHGQQSSRGIKNGIVIDMDGLERSIRLAVEDAERMADVQATNVRVAVSGSYIATRSVRGEISMNGREIGSKDVQKLLETVVAAESNETQHILHAMPLSYAIDGNDGVRDPRGMFADRLGVTLNLITMPMPVYRNIVLCVSRAHLAVESVNAAAFASAEAVLTEDERDNGAICIDLGGGSTGVSVFLNGTIAHLETLSVGGIHITSDLAHGVGTTVPAAERIKTLHGNVQPQQSAKSDFVEAPKIGDDGRLQAARMSKAELSGYILPRVEEIFELVSKHLSKSGLGGRLPRRAVLTGGGSDLPGVREHASRVLSMPVRLARPLRAEELGEVCQKPTYSTATGLLTLGATSPSKAKPVKAVRQKQSSGGEPGVFGKAFDWLKENI